MPQATSRLLPGAVPWWAASLGSLAIGFHLFAVVINTLAAPSGPWPTMQGADMFTPPQFAFSVNRDITNREDVNYLGALKMTHNYHFQTNTTRLPDVAFEVRLKDREGNLLETRRFPDKDANYWVRHRQAQLARWLAADRAVPPPGGEVVPAPGRAVPKVRFWEPVKDKNRHFYLEERDEHLVPRDQPTWQPSEWSMILARSYVRHLCRETGANSGELVRHTREAVVPAILFEEDAKQEALLDFTERFNIFGEFPK